MSSITTEPRPSIAGLDRAIMLIPILTILLTLLYLATAGGNFPLDDSWIHQTYARNLVEYGEWSFVPGQPSAASSSPLYTIILAVGYRLGIPYQMWTHGMGIAALALTGLLGAALAGRIAPSSGVARPAAGLTITAAWHLIWAAVSGMETPIFAMFVMLSIWLAWRELDPRNAGGRSFILRGALFGGVSALTTLTRAEGILLTGLLGLMLVAARPGRSWSRLVLYGASAVTVYVLMLAPYLIYNLQVTGGLLPNTAAAKAADATPLFFENYLWRLAYLLEPLAAGVQIVLLPGMAAYAVWLVRERKPILLAAPLLWSILLIGLYAAALPLNIQHGRYLIPALPSAILCGVVGIVWLLRQGRRSMLGRVLTRTLAAVAVVVTVTFALGLGLSAYRQDVAIVDQEMVASALWLKANIPPEDLLIVHDIGAVGYFAPRPLIDIAGLVNPEVIPLLFDPEGMWSLIEARGGRYLMALDNQVPGEDLSDPRLCRVFTTGGEAAQRAGGSNMSIYALTFSGNCP
ncbi:MAG: hypothetical protein L6Q98_10805 [Anaerolineae bacterium]|nr:hypothetical protein [Anaerolineae bacterium]NUQ02684.1 hypothetical protein [Anaerolineae bacterium]